MEKIGILCPSDTELEPFLEIIRSPRITEKAMLRFYEGQIGTTEVAAVYSGVCKVNAAIAAQLLIDIFQVSAIINAGTAGGIEESVKLLDTVISERAVYHDVARDILTEFHPWLESNCFRADPGLVSIARDYSQTCKYPMLFGTIATGEQFIQDENREKINRKFSPLCVDMETAAVAHVCHVNAVAFLGVRTITDTAAHSGIEAFDENCRAASRISAEIASAIIARLSDGKKQKQKI